MAGTGKGRVSNELVAASCAAVLAVYAAGYWRTRDAARSLDTQAQLRRSASPVLREVPAPPVAADAVPVEQAGELPVLPEPQPEPQPEVAGTPPPHLTEAASPPAAAVELPVAPASPAAPASPVEVTSPVAAQPPRVAAAGEILTPAAGTAVSGIAAAETTPAAPYWRDGTYSGWGTSRHGDIKSQVVIREGRIVEAGILSCETRWPCDVISSIIDQPVARQSPDVDRVSRATESANAYYFSLVNALSEALVDPSAAAAAPQ